MDYYELISEAIISGETGKVVKYIKEAVSLKYPSEHILKYGLIKGVNVISNKFKYEDVLIPEVLMSTRALHAGLRALQPYIQSKDKKKRVKIVMGTVYGDLLMKVLYRVRPYEKGKGSANQLYDKWVEICKDSLKDGKFSTFNKNIKNIIKEFDNFEINDIKKPRVGLVGEILVKFHPTANNNVVDVVEREGAEAVMPELINFFTAWSVNTIFKSDYLEGSKKSKMTAKLVISLVNFYQKTYVKELKNSKRFRPPKDIRELAKETEKVVSIGNQTGEGWLLTGEMIELIESGVENVICMQPFGCLPNHIIGKGSIKELKRIYKNANIIPIDYDPSASEVNQINRIKLMLSKAFKNMKNENNEMTFIDLNEYKANKSDKEEKERALAKC